MKMKLILQNLLPLKKWLFNIVNCFLTMLITAFLFIGCSKDDIAPEQDNSISTEKVSAPSEFKIFDYGNQGDARDFYFSFKKSKRESEITEYRLYLVNVNSQFPDIKVLVSEGYEHLVIEKKEADIESQVTNSFNDIEGNSIQNDLSYRAIIVAVGSGEEYISNATDEVLVSLSQKSYYEVQTLGSIIGAEALTLNPITQKIYMPHLTDLLAMDVTTGNYEVLESNLNQGLLGGSFDRNYENFYLSFFNTGELKRYEGNGQWTLIANNLNGPTGITTDVENNLYVASYWGDRIFKISTDGTKTVYAVSNFFNGLDGLVFIENILYAINFDDSNIMKILPDGTVSLFARLPFQVGNITGYITYADGYFYAANGPKLYSISLSGVVKTVAGSSERGYKDGPGPLSELKGVNGVAATASGDTVFLGDGNKIRMLLRRN